MRIRRDVVFISSVLFTIAFLCLIPATLGNVQAHPSEELGPVFSTVASMAHAIGVDSIAFILIGLIVTWKGYVKKIPWTWLVMLIIVGAWGFPLLVLDLIQHHSAITMTLFQILSRAWEEPGFARTTVEQVVIFLLMMAALVLPVKSFLASARSTREPARPSTS
jgi:hypothetical protein